MCGYNRTHTHKHLNIIRCGGPTVRIRTPVLQFSRFFVDITVDIVLPAQL